MSSLGAPLSASRRLRRRRSALNDLKLDVRGTQHHALCQRPARRAGMIADRRGKWIAAVDVGKGKPGDAMVRHGAKRVHGEGTLFAQDPEVRRVGVGHRSSCVGSPASERQHQREGPVTTDHNEHQPSCAEGAPVRRDPIRR